MGSNTAASRGILHRERMTVMNSSFRKSTGYVLRSVVLLALLAVPNMLHAQTVTLFGALANFDVLNDTGQDANGFEIELDGVSPQQVLYTFNATRYGGAQIFAIPGGVRS